MFKVLTIALGCVLLLNTVHALVAGNELPQLGKGAMALGLLLSLGLAFWLGRKYSAAAAIAQATAIAEAKSAAISRASAQARAQQVVQVNVAGEPAYSVGAYEDSLEDEVDLVEDAGDDFAIEGSAAGRRRALDAPGVPDVAAEVFSRLAAETAAKRAQEARRAAQT